MRLTFTASGCVPEDVGRGNIEHCKRLGLPFPKKGPSKRLAVIGGGHSIHDHIEALRHWCDDKWIIGSAYRFCLGLNIHGAFFCCAPSKDAIPLVKGLGIAHAIVATCSDPELLEALSGAWIEVFDIENNGSTSATCVPYLAARMEYEEVTFFGCDSSFRDTTHAYLNNAEPNMMRVRSNGQDFLTGPEFYMQAAFLSGLIKAAPGVFRNASGGLLESMIADPHHAEVTHGSRALFERLTTLKIANAEQMAA